MDWLPIESAPIGTPLIDVWGYDPTDDYAGPYRIPDCWQREDGVWFSMRFGELKRTVLTHWMRRPPPPAAKE